jgi:periplasmic binding family protein
MRGKSITTLFLLGLAVLSLVSRGTAQADDIAVVVNSSNPATNLSLGDLRKIFAGAKHSWPGGQAVKLVTRGSGCPERIVLLKLLAMSESEYKQYWTAQVFRGDADAEPLIVPSVGMQKEALSLFPGAISLVRILDVKSGMRVIRVDGLLPGAPGYPLH